MVAQLTTAARPRAEGVARDDARRSRTAPAAAVNRARRLELLGVVKGMLCDGVVSDAEAKALQQWLCVHPDAPEHWTIRAVNERVHRTLADGVLDVDQAGSGRDWAAARAASSIGS